MSLGNIALAIAVAVYSTNKIDMLQKELNEFIAEERNERTKQILMSRICKRDIHNKED